MWICKKEKNIISIFWELEIDTATTWWWNWSACVILTRNVILSKYILYIKSGWDLKFLSYIFRYDLGINRSLWEILL